jgi:hypothetical protein
MKEDEMGGLFSAQEETRNVYKFLFKSLKGRDHSESFDID